MTHATYLGSTDCSLGMPTLERKKEEVNRKFLSYPDERNQPYPYPLICFESASEAPKRIPRRPSEAKWNLPGHLQSHDLFRRGFRRHPIYRLESGRDIESLLLLDFLLNLKKDIKTTRRPRTRIIIFNLSRYTFLLEKAPQASASHLANRLASTLHSPLISHKQLAC